MLDFSEVCLNDKKIFDKYFKKINPVISELTFTNIFMWKHVYNFRYTIIGDILCLLSAHKVNGSFAFMPIGELNPDSFIKIFQDLKEYFRQRDWAYKFRKLTEKDMHWFDKYLGYKEELFNSNRDDWDYIYNSEDLINLKGKKYDAKRNHINKLKKKHEYEYISITESNIDEVIKVIDNWYDTKTQAEMESLNDERAANMNLLGNYSSLGVEGALIRVDGVCQAFTVGEMLNDDTAVIHIEKANPAIQGLYPLINQMFCTNTFKDVKYINREQDLGIAGIRKAKLSYHPIDRIKKSDLCLLCEKNI
jgi:uncharacterized protein